MMMMMMPTAMMLEAPEKQFANEGESRSDSGTSGKVVFLTGVGGFIGSHTAEVLLERGDKVVGIDEMNDYYDVAIKRANIELLRRKAAEVAARDTSGETSHEDLFVFAEADICERELVKSLFDEHNVTHVCHLAARAGVRPSIEDPFIYIHSNIVGTVSLMSIAAEHGVQNFVYASSSSVYGGSKKQVFAESDRVDNQVSQYAATKKSCELFAATYHSLYGLQSTGLRFFTVYGPRGRPDMAPYKFMNRIFNGITLQQYGDGSSARDYTYISDIVNGVVLAIDKPLGCEVVNLGKGNTCKLKEFISTIERLCGRKAKIEILPDQPGDVPYTCADTTKAAELLGYKPKVQLEEGLTKTVAWFRQYEESKKSRKERDDDGVLAEVDDSEESKDDVASRDGEWKEDSDPISHVETPKAAPSLKA
ncbi:UDP-glucose 4-epimerase [Hondaea fermentalgiana]|uniref:UDP-glucose 4-epimerase n=1 Tax=Hondaea fermentalgiana TaxID=2315210 RepID=A0A2R5GBQ5_9STRA|nr:UDP-glucose 4-epimerase [Hondaea fermentalgiana]|eukprot:GBG28015.1 UDP-glucose 4-epimerase [Hondaea fermentalgiana]